MSVALILGAGSRIGKGLAYKFSENGCKVALGSRSGSSEKPEGSISIQVDVTKPAEVKAAFAKSEQEFGAPVNIVVYNVAAWSPLPEKGAPFSLPTEQFVADMNAGALGAYTALQESVAAFKRVAADKPKVFIATSNLLGVSPPSIPMFALGNQKHNLAYFIQAGNKAYSGADFRFYLAAQVSSEGKNPNGELSPEAHGIVYWNLIQRAEKGGWDIRFIKDGSILVEN